MGRVTDEQADLQPRGRGLHHLEEPWAGEIDGRRAHLDVAPGAQRGGCFFQRPRTPGDEKEVQSLPGQLLRERGAQPLGPSGNESPRTVVVYEFVHWTSSIAAKLARRNAPRQWETVRVSYWNLSRISALT